VLDEVGNIDYNPLQTVIVLKVGDENDNRPQFRTITSPLTIGYPSAEIAKQLLPPYLTQVQVMQVKLCSLQKNKFLELRLPYS
jgi:hypothetical protein